ncbi:MAG: hypothetical protein KKH92_03230 [Firmicutes bacterium]|nr:hypothetical protein [Bacillota bacterium]
MKKILGMMFLAVIALTLIGCSALDPLSQFERVAAQEISSVQEFNDVTDEDTNDDEVEALYSGSIQVVSLSATTLDLTNQDKIDYIKSLFQLIRETHLENVALAESTKLSWDELILNIQVFRDSDLELLPDDKEILITYRHEIRTRRTEVRATFGDIKELFDELRGKYTIENLDMITENLEEVLNVLDLRQEYITYLNQVILDVDLMITSYNS